MENDVNQIVNNRNKSIQKDLKIIIKNPSFITLNMQVLMSNFATPEQIIRIIEKSLIKRNIMAERIYLE